MKRILLVIIFTLITSIQVFAQNTDGKKYKALKTAFITNALDLSPKEAQQFWPIYNKYESTVNQEKILKNRQLLRRINANGGLNSLTESQANAILEEFINIDFKVANAKKELYTGLKGVISSKKIIKLTKAEQDFNKELLNQLRNTRINNIKNRN